MTAGAGAVHVPGSRRKTKPEEESLRKRNAGTGTELPGLQFAYRLLTYRGRSEKEMRDRMALKGFDEHTIAAVIARLFSQGFLDDRRLAASLKRYAGETRHLGVGGTRQFLRQRGIPDEIIAETLTDIDEADLARKIIEKKMAVLRQYPQEKILRRLYGLLSRRGYSAETIRRALSTLTLTEDPR